MKLYDLAIVPVLVFSLFGYTYSVIDRASENGTKQISKAAIVKVVKHDLSKFHPSSTFVYNK